MKAPPRGVGVSGGDAGRSLSLSRLVRVDLVGVVRVGVDGDGGIPEGWDLVER
jgi:hypothetical protein